MGKVIRGSKESGKGARKRREGATVSQRVTLHNENERTAKRKKRERKEGEAVMSQRVSNIICQQREDND